MIFIFSHSTIKLCDYLDIFKDQVEVLWPSDKEYGCPITAGDYGGENIEVPMPYIPSIAQIVVSVSVILVNFYTYFLLLLYWGRLQSAAKLFEHLR